jgi:hypothetical protein
MNSKYSLEHSVPFSVGAARAVCGASHREIQASVGFTTVKSENDSLQTDGLPLSTN